MGVGDKQELVSDDGDGDEGTVWIGEGGVDGADESQECVSKFPFANSGAEEPSGPSYSAIGESRRLFKSLTGGW